MKPILLFLLTCAMWGQGKPATNQQLGPRSSLLNGMANSGNTPGKFYITGLAHTETDNDCTIPPIVVQAKDRIDAARKCIFRGEPCMGRGLTVWSEIEWRDYRKTVGAMFDKSCAATAKWIAKHGSCTPELAGEKGYCLIDEPEDAPKPAVSSDKPLGNNADGTVYDAGVAHEDNFHGSKTLVTTFPDHRPSFTVEKAVKEGDSVVASIVSKSHCNEDGFKWLDGAVINGGVGACEKITPIYKCKSRYGYRSFLLPDESTGEKVCLNVLKEKP